MSKLMRLLALSLATVTWFASSSFAAIDEPDAPSVQLRVEGATQDTAVREHVLVRLGAIGNSATQIVSGDAVVWDTVSDDGVTVRLTTTSADGAFAGIAVGTIPTADAASTSAFDDVGRRN